WFVYATFGHAAADFDHPVAPADDERDNISNVTPHAQFMGNAVYEFLPAISRGTSVPSATPRMELTTVDVIPGGGPAFEASIHPQDDTLWYRLVAGGATPRYVRLRPRATLAAIVEGNETPLPEKLVKATTVEILNLRPAMSYNLPAA